MPVSTFIRYDIVGLSMGQEFVLTQGYVGDTSMTPLRAATVFLNNRAGVVANFLAYCLAETQVTRHRVYFLSADHLLRSTYSQDLGLFGSVADDPVMPQLCVKIEKRGVGEFERPMRSRLHVPSVGSGSIIDGQLNLAATQMGAQLPGFLTSLITSVSVTETDAFGGIADFLQMDAAIIAKRPRPLPATDFRYQHQRISGFATARLATLRSRSPGRGR